MTAPVPPSPQPSHDTGLFGWLWRGYLGRHWVLIAVAGVLMAIEGSMMGLLSYMMKPMFDTVFIAGERTAIGWVGGIIFGIFVLRAVTSVGQKVVLTKIGAQVVFNIQTQVLGHLMKLDTLFHQAHPPGALIERVNGDSQALGQVASVVISGIGRDAVALLSLLAVVIWIDWQWTLVALLGTPIMVLPTILAQRYVRRTTLVSRRVAVGMTTRLDEIFHGIAPVKLNALEAYQTGRYRKLADERIIADVQAGLGRALIPALVDIMTGIGFCGVLIYGGSEIIDGTKTVGEFMSFFTAMALAFDPLRRLGTISGHWQAAAVSVGRLREMFETEPTLKVAANPVPLPAASGDLVLDNVTLNYGDVPVLQGTSFVAQAGKTTAIVGPSGAGKSTIFNILTRLAEPDGGRVSLGGVAIDQLDPVELRAQFSMVTQDALLFDESLRENILLGRHDVTDARLERALEAAQISTFVAGLPAGLETAAGPRGSALSGGQRQRVAIARAVLRDTPILLLDEATSALDAQSEQLVQRALETLAEGRTTLVIAHRLSTVRRADKIVVMERGRVVEQGTHDTLLARGGAYARLHALQFDTGNTD
jgi:ABC-type multidrug transport system fused ATPase/permease subunit